MSQRIAILGIVGAEGAKFDRATEVAARAVIRAYINRYRVEHVVSGKCHLGGIDIWCIEEAIKLGCGTIQFPALHRSWNTGYKPRNIQIANASDAVLCITVRTVPPDFKGYKSLYCYHCDTKAHVKSGGCWTRKYAESLGKQGFTSVV